MIMHAGFLGKQIHYVFSGSINQTQSIIQVLKTGGNVRGWKQGLFLRKFWNFRDRVLEYY